MSKPEWWEPSFGGYLLILVGGYVVMKVTKIECDNIDLIKEIEQEGEEVPESLRYKFNCFHGESLLEKGGKTLEEAKQICVDFAREYAQQILTELDSMS